MQKTRPGPAVRRSAPLSWDEVRRRNSVERIKFEKQPYDLLEDLPQLVEREYEEIAEDDVLRLQWWGLYHDKPKVGEFMMRVKIPGGEVNAAQLRAIGEISRNFGQDSGEITTRQDIQIHYVRLPAIPEIFQRLANRGLTTAGACGDILRNITGCPVSGIDREELFDTRPTLNHLAGYFYGNRDYSDLPRKHKWTISACPFQCNGPEIHDVGLIGTFQDHSPGFAIVVGGGLSTFPRIARSLGVFVRPNETLDVLKAILDIWSNDLNYRKSRIKARFKFMVEDHGPDAIRQKLEEYLGRTLTSLRELPQPKERNNHMGVHPQRQDGLSYVGFPVFPGLLSGRQMVRISELVEQLGQSVRFTRDQNLIVTGIEDENVDEAIAGMEEIGLSLKVHGIHGHSIGCTGNPHCNFAVGDTKPRLKKLVEHLESRFGDAVSDLRIHLDGCPHACGQHWVGDIGIQGTTVRIDGQKSPAYDVFLRGGLGADASIGRPVGRRIPTGELDAQVEALMRAYLEGRGPGQSFQSYCSERSDEELVNILQEGSN
ncbi:MAG TPA: nitrite/sulfite reductase [Acidobacteriota bacterium]|nr:nitrite/sulfite reductase [Acidobacteriota bacterium]